MTDYNDGKWHGWNGGECPVHPETVVEVVVMDEICGGTVSKGMGEIAAKEYTWSNDSHYNPIIAFRVVKEHKKPREVWVAPGFIGSDNLVVCRQDTPGARLFREVIE